MGAAQSTFRPPGVVLAGSSYLDELGADISYEKSISSSRFLKAIKARHRQGALVVKVFVKWDAHMDLRPTSKRIAAERSAMLDCPNLLPYSQALATERAGYLIRQWAASSLYDRISTRPFLDTIEKKWIAFQLLTAIKDMHARKIYHGDIKSENVLVTSWNWVYLADFASAFKPPYLPEDDPSDFSYFFDTSGRRTCYLAPERFYSADSELSRKKAGLEAGRRLGQFTEEMDVFSAGCVIAEMFVEGASPFTLAQLFQYKSGQYNLGVYLAQIEDEGIRNLVKSMMAADPSERQSCERYLTESYGSTFPTAFYDFFHNFIAGTNEISRTNSVSSALTRAMTTASPSGSSTPSVAGQHRQVEEPDKAPLDSNADDIIAQVWTDFDQIERYFTESRAVRPQTPAPDMREAIHMTDTVFPVHLNITTADGTHHLSTVKAPSADGPAIIVLSLVCANIRNCLRPTSIIKAFDILLALSRYLTDATKLDRLIPFVVTFMQNDVALVRASSLRTLTQVLVDTESITTANATVFTEYILPNIQQYITDPDESVRCVLAESLASLAETGQRYLDMAHVMKAEGAFKVGRARDHEESPYEMTYDASHQQLQSQIHDCINNLLTDPSSAVRRALVSNITPLCVFLGRSGTSDVFGLMVTHLNDRDWLSRFTFFAATVGVSTCIGSKNVDEYVLPLMTQALADNEETVVARELSSLAVIAELGLYQKSRLWEVLPTVLSLQYHPNTWIRSAAIQFLAASAKMLPETDLWCSLYPTLRTTLNADLEQLDQLSIMEALKTPVARAVYEAAVIWAGKHGGGSFWTLPLLERSSTLQQTFDEMLKPPSLTLNDEAELKRMEMIGMTEDDSMKLVTLRPFILNVSASRNLRGAPQSASSAQKAPSIDLMSSNEVAVTALGATPENIIFSSVEGLASRISRMQSDESTSRRTSMSEAFRPSNAMRANGGRSLSGTSTNDGLRRRIALASTLTSTPAVRSGSSPRFPSSLSVAGASTSFPSNAAADPPYATKLNSTDTATQAQPDILKRPAPPSSTASTSLRQRIGVGGVEMTKGQPAVASDLTAALGTLSVEGTESVSGISTPNPDLSRGAAGQSRLRGRRFETTYDGDDPSIRQLLDRVYLDNFREPMPEFGPFIPIKAARRRTARPSPRERPHKRPEGNLIANLSEHNAAVTCLAVSPDHLFFASGSTDGTVKIWDTARLEKNVASKSRLTIRQGGSITSIVMLENSHCIASASDNGSLIVHRINVSNAPGQLPRYAKPTMVRQHVVDTGFRDFVTSMLHFDTDAASKIVYGTSQSKLVILDIRTLRTLETYANPSHAGPISCMCIDRKKAWLVAGTLSGWLCLWDLRFGLLVQMWRLSDEAFGQAVTSITIHKTRGKGKWLVISAEETDGFEVWDIEAGRRVERFALNTDANKTMIQPALRRRTSSATTTATLRQADIRISASLQLSPADAIAELLAEPPKPMLGNLDNPDSAGALHALQYKTSRSAVTAIFVGSDFENAQEHAVLAVGSLPPVTEGSATSQEIASPSRTRPITNETGFIITGGDDRKIRFWDLSNVERSCVVCGSEDGEERPVFTVSRINGTSGQEGLYTESRPHTKSTSIGGSKRTQTIANSQQSLLRAHQDSISALALLELPFRCIVSADRSGFIKVWE